MKHFYSGMLVMLALMLAVVMGVVALAESAEPEAALPPVEDVIPAEQAPAEDAAEAPAATDTAALQEALNAYNAARQSSRVDNLEAELNGYVAAGKLTQAQADLILNYYKEQEALRNGTCPNCGYQFNNGAGFGKGGRMNGGKGNRGGKGGMRGMNGMSQQPGVNPGNAQTNSAAMNGWQAMPYAADTEGI